MNNKYFLVFLLLSLAACSQGFDRAGMRTLLSEGQNPVVSSSRQSLKEILELKPQLPKKALLGVYFENPLFWQLDTNLRQKVLDEVRAAVRTGPFYEIVSISKFDGDGPKPRRHQAGYPFVYYPSGEAPGSGEGPMSRYRRAAARYNADAVLVIRATTALDKYTNPLVLFDVLSLSITGLFLPAHNIDSLAMLNASVWDVRNGYLYATAESEGEDSVTAPLHWKGEQLRKTKVGAAHKAVNSLLPELRQRLGAIR